jgi:hypothetical protein
MAVWQVANRHRKTGGDKGIRQVFRYSLPEPGTGYSQEDMISLGFSARHWQKIEPRALVESEGYLTEVPS